MFVYLLAARSYCQKMGGDLASLSDPSAFAAVQGICQRVANTSLITVCTLRCSIQAQAFAEVTKRYFERGGKGI
jgi:hypothetical protein